jgi:hypothetical protein
MFFRWRYSAFWLAASIVSSFFLQGPPAIAAAGDPTVAWTEPTAGSTVTGNFRLRATYAVASGSTAQIAKVCLTKGGAPLSTYNTGSDGCTPSSYWPSTNGDSWLLDSSGWTNGTHVFTIQVTDTNGRVSNVATISITSNNASVTPPPNGGSDGETPEGGSPTPTQALSVSCSKATTQVCTVRVSSSPANQWPSKTKISLRIFVKTTGYSKTYTLNGAANGATKFRVPPPAGTGFAAWKITAFTSQTSDSQEWTRGSPKIVTSGKSLPFAVTWQGVAVSGASYFCKALPRQMKNIGTWIVADNYGFNTTVHAYNFWNANLYLTMVQKSRHVVVYVPYSEALRYKCPFAFRVDTP